MNWGKDDNWPYKHKMPFREFFPSAGDPNISVPDGKDGTGEIDDDMFTTPDFGAETKKQL